MGDLFIDKKNSENALENPFFLPYVSLFLLVVPQFESAQETNIPGDSPKCPLSESGMYSNWYSQTNPNPEGNGLFEPGLFSPN